MKVPSTETIYDRQKEHKDLMAEIILLRNEKENLKREITEYTEAKTILNNEVISGVKVSDLKDTVLNNIRAKIREEVDTLTKTKDSLEKVTDNKKREFNKFKKDNDEHKEKNKSLLEDKERLINEIAELRKNRNEEEDLLNKEIEKKKKSLNELVKLNDLEVQKMNDFKNEYEQKKSELMKQEIRLANKGSDLNIYEQRLRAKYLELMPDMEIVV